MYGGSQERQGRPPKATPSVRISSRCPTAPAPPFHLVSAAGIIESWALERGATTTQIQWILGCLNSDYLLQLSLLSGMRIDRNQLEARVL